MASTGRFTGEEKFAARGRLEHFAVDIGAVVHTRTKERKRT